MVLLSLLLACADKPADTAANDRGGDTAAQADDSGAPSGDSGEDTAPTDPLVAPAVDLGYRLHDSIGSLIYATWTQAERADSVTVEYSFDPGQWHTAPAREGTEGAHEQLLLGVPYGASVTWRVLSQRGEQRVSSAEAVAVAGAAPEGMPGAALELDVGGWWEGGRYLLTSVSSVDLERSSRAGFWLIIADRAGRVVWSYELPETSWTLFPKPSRDGRALLWDESTFWSSFDGGQEGAVHRMTLDGVEERAWATPGLHHSFDDLDPDTLLWNSLQGVDDIVYLSSGDEAAVELWSCREWMSGEVVGGDSEGGVGSNYCGANALNWSPDSDTVILSLFSHETVLELDPWSGEVLWYADPRGGNGLSLSDAPEWYWQHDAQLVAPDRLLLTSGVPPEGGGGAGDELFERTALYEYSVDREGGRLALEWSDATEGEWVSQYKGGAWRLENGNTLHYLGDFPGVREVTPEGQEVWALRFTGDEQPWIGRATLLEDLYAFAP